MPDDTRPREYRAMACPRGSGAAASFAEGVDV